MFLPKDLNYYIISLGCSKNQTESEKINSLLESTGMTSSENPVDSDIIIINTCGFIEDAKKEAIEVIFDGLEYKDDDDEKPFSKKIAAIGCFTQRYKEEILKEIPELDFLYGNVDDHLIPELFREFDIEYNSMNTKYFRVPLVSGLAYEYIKISDGCSNNCSYCAIPLIRGPLKSFSFDDVLQDAKEALERGAKELILIAQDVTAYEYDGKYFPDLINAISLLPGEFWIRILYCHPDNISDELISEMKNNKKVVPYIDIPFQHVSKKILSDMNRKGDYYTYIELINKLRDNVDNIVIRSTFMVGYPGEGDEEFEELLDFIKIAKLEKVGCFTYSPEEGTKTYGRDNVDQKIKRARYRKLMKLQKKISTDIMKEYIGKRVKVLIEEKIDDDNYIGRTQYDAPEIDGVFYLTSKKNQLNIFVEAKITDSVEYDLIGEL